MELINAPKPAGTLLERKVSTARKEHVCFSCKKQIAKKTQYVIHCVSQAPYNNAFFKYHLECEPKQ